jgi:hypothetical protein
MTMGCDVFANNDEIACKAGDGKVIAAFPDVCLSPPSPPAGPVPVPYPDTSFSKDMQNGSKTVMIKDQEVMLKDQSFYKTSPLGDEAATNGLGAGVVTHVITGKTYFIAWSMDVQFEGQNVDRHMDMTTSNHASPPGNQGTGKNLGVATPPRKCPPHIWKRLPDSDTPEDRIKALEASSQSGDQYNACLARKFQKQGKNVDVTARYKCDDCGEYQEVDMIVDGKLKEAKAGNQSAKKKQIMNYVEIQGGPVTVCYQSAARAAKDTPHVARWGATAAHEPCP